MGTDAVGVLGASGSSAQSISLTAPSTAGTYYYGACVDAVTDESDTTNNCSASVKVDVETPRYPDLEVGTPTVNESTPETGASITLSATVSNTGDGESPATTLRYYRSTDATITTTDTSVGTDAVGVLAALGSSSESVDLTVPTTAGTYYYGACVDAVTDESDTTNNCSASVQVTVTAPLYPDLRISAIGGPTDVNVGDSFALLATVSNTGDGESPATTLRYYRSTDATITTTDTSVGTDAVGVLAALGSSGESVNLTAPLTAGTYYYGACVDAVTDESDTNNNCSSSVQVTVTEPQLQEVEAPDLEVGTPTVNNASPEPGATFTLSATVSNTGDGESPATILRYYRSTLATFSNAATAVGTDDVGILSASGTSAESISLTAPYNPRAFYFTACVDSVTGESDTTNNCSASVKVTVSPPNRPELVMTNIGASYNGNIGTSFNVNQGETFTLMVTGRNVGSADAGATTMRLYRSTDSTITTSDTEVATISVPQFSASSAVALSRLLVTPSTAGTYYYGACVDSVAGETDTTNNCSASVQVTVPAQPDLEVGTPSVDNSTPAAGATFTLSATVSNTGDGEAAATTLNYYQSTDATITTSDTSVGTDAIGALSASGTSDQSIDLTAPSSGTYYYGACVDSVADESDTTHNCSGSVQVDVQ